MLPQQNQAALRKPWGSGVKPCLPAALEGGYPRLTRDVYLGRARQAGEAPMS